MRIVRAVTSARDSKGNADVVARLREAHEGIRAALAGAAAIAAGEVASSQGRAEVAREVLAQLTIDMALHEADEDASIAPRLGEAERSLEGVIERLEEHAGVYALVAELAEDWQRMCGDGAMPRDPLRHRARFARLRRMLEAHLAGEECHVFPRIAALPESIRAEIIREMDERRDALGAG